MDETDKKIKSKWLLFSVLAGIVVIIIIRCFSGTPSATKADTETRIITETDTDFSFLGQPMPDFTGATPRVEAICISNSGKSSIYAEKEFGYEGDIINGFKILKIYPDKVEFEKDGKKITAAFPRP